jgi:hypothetical protein
MRDKKRYRIKAMKMYADGAAPRFCIEVYEPRPGYTPWRTLEGSYPSYKAASEAVPRS